jgi:hypothetical protein
VNGSVPLAPAGEPTTAKISRSAVRYPSH